MLQQNLTKLQAEIHKSDILVGEFYYPLVVGKETQEETVDLTGFDRPGGWTPAGRRSS